MATTTGIRRTQTYRCYPDLLKKANVRMSRRQQQSGFSIVDLMVGMLLSLIGMVIIFQVFEVSERVNRTSSSGSDSQQNAAIALYTLERAIKEAGYGLAPDPFDPIKNLVQISTSVNSALSQKLTISKCLLELGPAVVQDIDGNYIGCDDSNASGRRTEETFEVNDRAQLVSSSNGVLADGIVQMQAQYGWDVQQPLDGKVDEWGTNINSDASILAVRLAVVARSAPPEKPSTGKLSDPCDTTTKNPAWAGGNLDLSGNLNLPAGDSWQCYRYKTFQVTVPLRNRLWKPK